MRNLLGDFDAFVERALVAAGEEREAAEQMFAGEALLMAEGLAAWCLEDEHQRDRKRFDATTARRFLDLALTATRRGHFPNAALYALQLKGYVRARSCACTKGISSCSGRPVW